MKIKNSFPDIAYHGTNMLFLDSIKEQGLISHIPNNVHITSEISVAKRYAERHENPLLLKIDCEKMIKDGYVFYEHPAKHTALLNNIPFQYIKIIQGGTKQ